MDSARSCRQRLDLLLSQSEELSLRASACSSTLSSNESFGWGVATVVFVTVRVALAGLCRGWSPQRRGGGPGGGISRGCLMPHSWGIGGRSLLRGLCRSSRSGSTRSCRNRRLRQGRTLPTAIEAVDDLVQLLPSFFSS